MTSETALFDTVPEDCLSINRDYRKIVSLLNFEKKDVAKAANIPLASVRYDEKMPRELRERFSEWAVLLNLVASYFKGDPEKTVLWFTVRNPLLGNVAPRDMIRFGRYNKLYHFIWNAIHENKPWTKKKNAMT
jgi:hypothetical protein